MTEKDTQDLLIVNTGPTHNHQRIQSHGEQSHVFLIPSECNSVTGE